MRLLKYFSWYYVDVHTTDSKREFENMLIFIHIKFYFELDFLLQRPIIDDITELGEHLAFHEEKRNQNIKQSSVFLTFDNLSSMIICLAGSFLINSIRWYSFDSKSFPPAIFEINFNKWKIEISLQNL